MRQPDRNLKQSRSLSARIGAALSLLLTLGLLAAAPAAATYEQVDTFAEELGNGGLQFVSGMAVNAGGAGGVPAGTVYAVRADGGDALTHVYTYNAKGEFLGTWSQTIAAKGIAVDQATGNIYVLSVYSPAILVYSPDGSKLIASFGEQGKFSETFDEGPGKIHNTATSGIAVDESGTVYVNDAAAGQSRVMTFEPQSPGDYEHYVYAGRADDIAVEGGSFVRLVVDDAGNLYAAGNEFVAKFAPGEHGAPACEFSEPKGGIQAMTVNPASGEAFYFSSKNLKIHQLAPCNGQGELVETASFAPAPKTNEIRALAFNPALAWEASRPAGVLYGAKGGGECEGPGMEECGRAYIFASAKEIPPLIESESVSSVTSTSASLGAQINPKGSVTRYAFQYLTEAAYEANEPADRFAGATEAPLGGALLGSGQGALGAGTALAGLTPDTEYRYRVIATSHCDPKDEEEICEDSGEAQAFRTFPAEAPGLPDHRAWELVSPVQKSGGQVLPADAGISSCGYECKPGGVGGTNHFPMQSSPDGEAVVYEGLPFSTTEGAARFNEYVSRRTASGWQTTILAPRLFAGIYEGFDAGLSRGLLYEPQPGPTLSPEAPGEYANLYAQGTTDPSALSPLLGSAPPNRPPGGSFTGQVFTLEYAGASADFTRLFFEANDALTPETPFAPEAVDGGAKENNLYEWAGGQLRLINVAPGNAETAPGAQFGSGKLLVPSTSDLEPANFSHAISADGSRVFWSDEAGQVYVREDGESTREIPDPGKFLTASADGSKVLLNDGHLVDLGDEEPVVDLTQGQDGFQGIAGQSEDLTHLYFVDTAVLSGEEENEYGAKAEAGEDNLYAYDEGSTAFIGTLLAGDNFGSGPGDWTASPVKRTAEASPGGRWLAFLSQAPLTGYDNSGCGKEKSSPCAEAFLYDSTTGHLVCASCNPTGTRPLGFSTLSLLQFAKGANPQPRYLSDEGRLFFDSQDSLSPFDTNEGVEDVYEYEPQGVGSCKREAGCLSLISAGHEPVDSNFLAADPSGENVFFTTRDQLVLKDTDELIDVYDAREEGGIPSETETARGECQGEACQPQISPPNDPTPGSSSFEGAGNVDEKKAAKKHKHKKHKHAKKRHKRSGGRTAKHSRGGTR